MLDGYDLDLRTKEFDLLVHLASQPGRVFSRSQLLEGVWGGDKALAGHGPSMFTCRCCVASWRKIRRIQLIF